MPPATQTHKAAAFLKLGRRAGFTCKLSQIRDGSICLESVDMLQLLPPPRALSSPTGGKENLVHSQTLEPRRRVVLLVAGIWRATGKDAGNAEGGNFLDTPRNIELTWQGPGQEKDPGERSRLAFVGARRNWPATFDRKQRTDARNRKYFSRRREEEDSRSPGSHCCLEESHTGLKKLLLAPGARNHSATWEWWSRAAQRRVIWLFQSKGDRKSTPLLRAG